MHRPSDDSTFQKLVTAAELAQIISLSKSMIYKLVNQENMPYYSFGKAIRFDVDEVKQWAKRQSVQSSSSLVSGNEEEQSRTKHSSPKETQTSLDGNLERDVDRILKSTSIGGEI